VGVLELDAPVTEINEFAQLPTKAELIDDLYGESKNATYTTVGYGLTKTLPSIPDEGGDARNVATVKINNLNGVWGTPRGVAVAFSSNNGRPHQGGTCFGDSGGPTFPNVEGETTTIITVTSFAIDQNCRAGGGGYRLDQEDDLTWLASVLAPTAAP
jgi:hypothetical protein